MAEITEAETILIAIPVSNLDNRTFTSHSPKYKEINLTVPFFRPDPTGKQDQQMHGA